MVFSLPDDKRVQILTEKRSIPPLPSEPPTQPTPIYEGPSHGLNTYIDAKAFVYFPMKVIGGNSLLVSRPDFVCYFLGVVTGGYKKTSSILADQ